MLRGLFQARVRHVSRAGSTSHVSRWKSVLPQVSSHSLVRTYLSSFRMFLPTPRLLSLCLASQPRKTSQQQQRFNNHQRATEQPDFKAADPVSDISLLSQRRLEQAAHFDEQQDFNKISSRATPTGLFNDHQLLLNSATPTFPPHPEPDSRRRSYQQVSSLQRGRAKSFRASSERGRANAPIHWSDYNFAPSAMSDGLPQSQIPSCSTQGSKGDPKIVLRRAADHEIVSVRVQFDQFGLASFHSVMLVFEERYSAGIHVFRHLYWLISRVLTRRRRVDCWPR